MKNFVLLFITSVFLFSCQDVQVPEKPKNLIPKEKMVQIFTDAYLANAARNLNAKIIKDSKVALDSLLYRKYDIDSLQFAQSNAYYSLDFNTYKEILETVEKNLLKRKTELDTLVKKKEKADKEKKKKDRIRVLKEKKKKKDSFLKKRLVSNSATE